MGRERPRRPRSAGKRAGRALPSCERGRGMSSSSDDTTARTSDVSRPRSLLTPVDDSHPDRAAILEAERTAIADAERPGSWFGEDGADGRMLTQEATDML